MMGKLKGALVLILLGAAGWGGWWAWQRRSANGRERSMRMVEASEGSIEDTVDATGSIVPLNRIEVKPPISGRMEQLLVDEGDKVEKGRIMAWMSSSDRAAILDAARAQGPDQLKRWEDSYKPTPIVAPLSGVVILRNVVVGQNVDNTVLFALADSLIALAQVDESDIGRVKLGMSARIVLDAYPTKTAPGKVFDILYEGKNVSNVITYGVKVKPDVVPPFFRSQMTANVSFILGRKERAVLLQSSAVQEAAGGGRQVLVPGPEGKSVTQLITTGLESGDKVEILSGLEAGDRVFLARGRYKPQEGPQSSPLGFTGPPRPSPSTGQAPRKRGAASTGRGDRG